MLVIDLLRLMEQSIEPGATKFHLATWSGEENTLDVFLADDFPEWQRWQVRVNFEKSFVVVFIALSVQFRMPPQEIGVAVTVGCRGARLAVVLDGGGVCRKR